MSASSAGIITEGAWRPTLSYQTTPLDVSFTCRKSTNIRHQSMKKWKISHEALHTRVTNFWVWLFQMQSMMPSSSMPFQMVLILPTCKEAGSWWRIETEQNVQALLIVEMLPAVIPTIAYCSTLEINILPDIRQNSKLLSKVKKDLIYRIAAELLAGSWALQIYWENPSY